jgi:hypothetical protein
MKRFEGLFKGFVEDALIDAPAMTGAGGGGGLCC